MKLFIGKIHTCRTFWQ